MTRGNQSAATPHGGMDRRRADSNRCLSAERHVHVQAPERPSRQGWVYFVRSTGGRSLTRVKIGWALDPEKRLKYLQIGSPVELELVGAFRGTRSDERAVQKQFEFYRTHGEWFLPSHTILDFIVERCEVVNAFIQSCRAAA